MDEPGLKLKRTRERLGLRYRDVEEFSQQIADRRKNNEFIIAISRLADIENRGVVPSIFKLYSLCAIYRLDLAEVLRWYGVDAACLGADSLIAEPDKTHPIGLGREPIGPAPLGEVQVPLSLDPGVDLRKTTFLSRFIQNWGNLPLMLVAGLDLKQHRYAFVGLEDLFMYPLIQPGSLLLIDETKKRIADSGWASEYDRPVYFLEHRQGWLCAWCSVSGDRLVALPHPVSGEVPLVFQNGVEVDVVGQVVGVANRWEPIGRLRTRS
jgi:transcriptional regulator with XRE-family HTH domain